MESRVLPIGIQSFSKIRENNYLYVDKTEYIYSLASNAGIYFLSRPRRFGKSLLISTLSEYLSGNKKLFKGLKIEKLEEEKPTGENGAWTPSPVIKFDFNSGMYDSVEGLKSAISYRLSNYEQELGVTKEFNGEKIDLSARFDRLIRETHRKTGLKVAVLVDEYDKPLLQNISNETLNSEMRQILKSFFGVLKSVDDLIRFVMITGVTKFSHVSIFSDLNQLNDISMDNYYNAICGITLSEIEENFNPEIDIISKSLSLSREDIIKKLTLKYDGYCFTEPKAGVSRIYNPFSLLSCFFQKAIRNYWFATGTPTFLVEIMKSTHYDVQKLLTGVDAKVSFFNEFRADSASPIPLFYQSGYLTIGEYDSALQRYKLVVPNDEVKYGLVESFIPLYLGIPEGTGTSVEDFVAQITEGDIDGFMQSLAALIASIPYDDTRKADKTYSYEYTYKVAVFLIFTLAGQYIRSEVHTIKGRMDAVCETSGYVYIFEFKMSNAPDGSSDAALQQIENQEYDIPFKASGKQIVKIGIVFDANKRNITEWKAIY